MVTCDNHWLLQTPTVFGRPGLVSLPVGSLRQYCLTASEIAVCEDQDPAIVLELAYPWQH